jgi:hypothetical protein
MKKSEKTRMHPSVKHLFLRIPKNRKNIEEFCRAHNEVSTTRRAVWVGVTGASLSAHRQRELTQQINANVKTYLYVAQMVKRGGVFVAYKSKISDIVSSRSSVDLELLPAYYPQDDIITLARFWIKINLFEKIGSGLFQSLRVAQSGKRAADVLRRSMLSRMFVSEAEQQR